MSWHAQPVEQVLSALETSASGLDEEEAAARRARVGRNELRPPRPTPWWRVLGAQIGSVVVLLLFGALVMSAVMGDLADAIAIGAALALNIGLGFVLELRGRRAVESLRALDTPNATVVRGGAARLVDARDLVPGDVIQLAPGDTVPADARLITAAELTTSEAALTGESFPVSKRAGDVLAVDTPLADRVNMLYKATSVVQGSARAVVTGTGMATEIGRVGTLVGSIRDEPTPLERRLAALGRRLALASIAVGALVALLEVLRRSSLLEVVQTGIAVAVAAVPEGLPAVVTIAMAIGIRRMAARNALIRRLPAVESLGSATVICTDKTGTLTAGQQTATTLWLPGTTHNEGEIQITGTGYEPRGQFRSDGVRVTPAERPDLEMALTVGALCNDAALVHAAGGWTATGDPTEAALLAAARKAGLDDAALRATWPREGEIPFSSERMLMTTFHRSPAGTLVAMMKGAPARVLEHCAMTPESRTRVVEWNQQLADRGLRVLALARGTVPGMDALGGLEFVGLVGMTDPPAEGVAETIQRLRDAGIRTVMLTGDQRGTARAVARELALGDGDAIVDGSEVDRLSDEALVARVGDATGFTRVSPEAKLRIVTALQARGELVAMLGDGVNDAAALKKADIGVAMGRRGTDVAKDAAGLILTDDRFTTVAAAVEEGRVVFDNVRKFVFYLFSCNLAEIISLVVAGALSLPSPLTALQILWLNLVTDTFPALALALEPPERHVMRRPPRDPRSALLSAQVLRGAAFYAALIAASTLGAFFWTLSAAPDRSSHAPTVAFMTLGLAQLFHLGNARSGDHVASLRRAISNPWALGSLVLGCLLQVGVAFHGSLATLLGISPLSARDWLVIVPFALTAAVIGQVLRSPFLRRRAAFAIVFLVLSAGIAVGVWRYIRSAPRPPITMGRVQDAPAPLDAIAGRMLELSTGLRFTNGNVVSLLTNGDETYPRLWADLRSARSTVTLQSYYALPGAVADTLSVILRERARAGVRVLVLFDAFGSQSMPRRWRDSLGSAGVRFVMLRPLRWSTLHTAANRSHVRAIVIDGRVGYTGGFGFADYWLGSGRRPNEWRDSNVRVEGPVVAELQATFAAAWVEATGELLSGDPFYPRVLLASRAGTRDSSSSGVLAGIFFSAPTVGNTTAERFLSLMIGGSRSRLYITNSYFVPNADFRRMLEQAAARGVDVRVLTAGAASDVTTTWLAGRHHYDQLLAAGVRIFEYQPTMIHAKTIVVDGVWSTIGSMNFDNRSLAYNDEVNFVAIDSTTGVAMESIFLADAAHAREITRAEFRERPWWMRLGETAVVLLGRLL